MTSATVPLADGRPPYGVPPVDAGATDPFDAAPVAGPNLPCRSSNPDLWFAETPTDLEVAKRLCGSCPVRSACLAGALARHEPWGVWGGEIFDRGVVVPRKRPRGRPRKNDPTHVINEDAAARVVVTPRAEEAAA